MSITQRSRVRRWFGARSLEAFKANQPANPVRAHPRKRLPEMVVASAAWDEVGVGSGLGMGRIEVLLVDITGASYEFDIGPVAALSFSLLLGEAVRDRREAHGGMP